MHITNLRRVGGSVMLAVPPTILDVLELKTGASVGIEIEDGHLIVRPRRRVRYTLGELIAGCSDVAAPEDKAWLGSAAVGRELI